VAINRKPYTSVEFMESEIIRRSSLRLSAQFFPYVIGEFVQLDNGWVVLEAICESPGFWIDPAAPLTRVLSAMAKWRTRQAVHQWMREHRVRPGLRLVNAAALLGSCPRR
jgi:hypothetical protein